MVSSFDTHGALTSKNAVCIWYTLTPHPHLWADPFCLCKYCMSTFPVLNKFCQKQKWYIVGKLLLILIRGIYFYHFNIRILCVCVCVSMSRHLVSECFGWISRVVSAPGLAMGGGITLTGAYLSIKNASQIHYSTMLYKISKKCFPTSVLML